MVAGSTVRMSNPTTGRVVLTTYVRWYCTGTPSTVVVGVVRTLSARERLCVHTELSTRTEQQDQWNKSGKNDNPPSRHRTSYAARTREMKNVNVV